MRSLLTRLTLFAAFLPAAAFGDPLTVKQAIELAQSKSPDIRSLEHQVESSEAKTRQALAPSEPSLQLNYNDMPSFPNPRASASTVYQISQPIAFPGKAFVNQAASRNQSKALYQTLRSKRLAVSIAVRTTYYNLALARKNLELNLDQKRSYEQILAIAKRRYEAGSITQVDLMIAQSSIYSNENDLTDLQAGEKTTLSQLNLLLGNPAFQEVEIEPLKMPQLKPFDREESITRMLANQPEIQSASYQEKAAENTLTSAYMALLPDFQIFGGVTYYNVAGASPLSSASGLNQTYMAGIQLTIPIWAFFDQREGINSATHDRATAQAALDSQLLQSKTTLESTLQSIDALQAKLKNYQQHLIPLAEQTLNLALTNYSAGKIDFQALSDAAGAWRTTKTAYYAMVSSYLTTYYSVGQLIGEEL